MKRRVYFRRLDPGQFPEFFGPQGHFEGPEMLPIRNLYVHYLMRAVADLKETKVIGKGRYQFVLAGGNRNVVYHEIRNWFRTDNDEGIFSFPFTCYLLGLDPGVVRRELKPFF
jgi:hypothetical protein